MKAPTSDVEVRVPPRGPVTEVHTLGPAGTNCEAAARKWLAANDLSARVILHSTLEDALQPVKESSGSAVLLACVVYPQLHTIVFENLDWLRLQDEFIMNTYNMVLAARPGGGTFRTAVSHPAPRHLAELKGLSVTEATSNSKAARLCSSGEFDACITTAKAAQQEGLVEVEDYGPVPMGFTVHAVKVDGGVDVEE